MDEKDGVQTASQWSQRLQSHLRVKSKKGAQAAYGRDGAAAEKNNKNLGGEASQPDLLSDHGNPVTTTALWIDKSTKQQVSNHSSHDAAGLNTSKNLDEKHDERSQFVVTRPKVPRMFGKQILVPSFRREWGKRMQQAAHQDDGTVCFSVTTERMVTDSGHTAAIGASEEEEEEATIISAANYSSHDEHEKDEGDHQTAIATVPQHYHQDLSSPLEMVDPPAIRRTSEQQRLRLDLSDGKFQHVENVLAHQLQKKRFSGVLDQVQLRREKFREKLSATAPLEEKENQSDDGPRPPLVPKPSRLKNRASSAPVSRKNASSKKASASAMSVTAESMADTIMDEEETLFDDNDDQFFEDTFGAKKQSMTTELISSDLDFIKALDSQCMKSQKSDNIKQTTTTEVQVVVEQDISFVPTASERHGHGHSVRSDRTSTTRSGGERTTASTRSERTVSQRSARSEKTVSQRSASQRSGERPGSQRSGSVRSQRTAFSMAAASASAADDRTHVSAGGASKSKRGQRRRASLGSPTEHQAQELPQQKTKSSAEADFEMSFTLQDGTLDFGASPEKSSSSKKKNSVMQMFNASFSVDALVSRDKRVATHNCSMPVFSSNYSFGTVSKADRTADTSKEQPSSSSSQRRTRRRNSLPSSGTYHDPSDDNNTTSTSLSEQRRSPNSSARSKNRSSSPKQYTEPSPKRQSNKPKLGGTDTQAGSRRRRHSVQVMNASSQKLVTGGDSDFDILLQGLASKGGHRKHAGSVSYFSGLEDISESIHSKGTAASGTGKTSLRRRASLGCVNIDVVHHKPLSVLESSSSQTGNQRPRGGSVADSSTQVNDSEEVAIQKTHKRVNSLAPPPSDTQVPRRRASVSAPVKMPETADSKVDKIRRRRRVKVAKSSDKAAAAKAEAELGQSTTIIWRRRSSEVNKGDAELAAAELQKKNTLLSPGKQGKNRSNRTLLSQDNSAMAELLASPRQRERGAATRRHASGDAPENYAMRPRPELVKRNRTYDGTMSSALEDLMISPDIFGGHRTPITPRRMRRQTITGDSGKTGVYQQHNTPKTPKSRKERDEADQNNSERVRGHSGHEGSVGSDTYQKGSPSTAAPKRKDRLRRGDPKDSDETVSTSEAGKSTPSSLRRGTRSRQQKSSGETGGKKDQSADDRPTTPRRALNRKSRMPSKKQSEVGDAAVLSPRRYSTTDVKPRRAKSNEETPTESDVDDSVLSPNNRKFINRRHTAHEALKKSEMAVILSPEYGEKPKVVKDGAKDRISSTVLSLPAQGTRSAMDKFLMEELARVNSPNRKNRVSRRKKRIETTKSEKESILKQSATRKSRRSKAPTKDDAVPSEQDNPNPSTKSPKKNIWRRNRTNGTEAAATQTPLRSRYRRVKTATDALPKIDLTDEKDIKEGLPDIAEKLEKSVHSRGANSADGTTPFNPVKSSAANNEEGRSVRSVGSSSNLVALQGKYRRRKECQKS
jgi:hypothetical protein